MGKNHNEVYDFVNEVVESSIHANCFIIPTLKGEHICSPGDFIIEDVKGEHYTCKPDIFALTFEETK